MKGANSDGAFSLAVENWLLGNDAIESAVVFGSSARMDHETAAADAWSDLDLHVITSDAAALEQVNWAKALKTQRFRFQVVRPATGGVRKVTALFSAGQIDLVIVPVNKMLRLRTAMRTGRHHKPGPLCVALNEMNTCLRSGYRFLKGERRWGAFYARVATGMPGVRMSDDEARQRAAVSLTDALWILQKLARGELAAAQHLLHRSLAETNFALIRELRLRRGEPLASFGLGRRVEALLSREELRWVTVNARLERRELRRAVGNAVAGLEALMKELVPTWRAPSGMKSLLVEAGLPPRA